MHLRVLIIGCSLNPSSRSRQLARRALDRLQAREIDATLLDLKQTELPLCDGFHEAHIDPAIGRAIDAADVILIATPIYNYDANAAAKNLIELTGKRWTDKLVGFLCAAGGHGSYMSIMGLANSLMLDFRCLIIPRFVYASSGAFGEHGELDPKVDQRIDELCEQAVRLGLALKQSEAPAGRE